MFEKRKTSILVKISEQKLYLLNYGNIEKSYSISSSRFGIGNKIGSFKTPLGKHKIIKKIGKHAKIGTVFHGSQQTRKVIDLNAMSSLLEGDIITTRIMCLEGLEKGVNRGGKSDTRQRYIWIHGTIDEESIGKPASRGCIRMKNRDIIELFKLVRKGTIVQIEE